MRKKIIKKLLCLVLVIQVLSHVAQAEIVTVATKSTTKAAVTTKPVVTTKAASKDEDCSDETKKTTYESCSASSSSESQGKFKKSRKGLNVLTA